MTLHRSSIAFLFALSTTVAIVSCEELPETQLKNRAGASGKGTSGSAGTSASSGGAGNGGMPGGGNGGTAGGASGGTSGSGSNTGGASGNGNGGSGGRGAGAGGTGMDDGGEGGAMPGGGPGSGGSNGGFSTDPDDFFGNPRCNSQFALCEDFESGSLDTDLWEPRGSVEIVDDQAARGTHSAHFHAEDNGIAYITQTEAFPAPGNKYFARIFVRFDSMPTAPDWAHWTVAGAQDATAGDNAPEIRVGGQLDSNQDKNLFGVGSDRGDTGDWTNLDGDNGAQPVPVQEWVCLEWMFDGGANETKFWWDGVEHPSLATSETEHGGDDVPFILPEFGSSWFGWWLYQPNTNPTEFDVWIDEIVIDYERVGCEN